MTLPPGLAWESRSLVGLPPGIAAHCNPLSLLIGATKYIVTPDLMELGNTTVICREFEPSLDQQHLIISLQTERIFHKDVVPVFAESRLVFSHPHPLAESDQKAAHLPLGRGIMGTLPLGVCELHLDVIACQELQSPRF